MQAGRTVVARGLTGTTSRPEGTTLRVSLMARVPALASTGHTTGALPAPWRGHSTAARRGARVPLSAPARATVASSLRRALRGRGYTFGRQRAFAPTALVGRAVGCSWASILRGGIPADKSYILRPRERLRVILVTPVTHLGIDTALDRIVRGDLNRLFR